MKNESYKPKFQKSTETQENKNHHKEKFLSSLLIGLVILASFLLVSRIILTLKVKTATYDEMKYLKAGIYLANNFKWNTQSTAKHPPLSYLAHGLILKNHRFISWENRLFWARVCMIPFVLLLSFFLFKWGYEIYGKIGGVLVLILFSCDPNIIAHSCFITSDIVVSCFIFICVYYFYKLLLSQKKKYVWYTGLSLGLALLSKHTALLLLFILPFLTILYLYFGKNIIKRKDLTKKLYFKNLAKVLLIALLVLNIGYGFSGTFTPFKDFNFQSNSLQTIKKAFYWLPIPCPPPYIMGLDRQQHINEVGHPAYLLGQKSTHGWWYYFIIGFLVKEPLVIILLLCAAIFTIIKFNSALQKKLEVSFLLVPPLIIFLHFSLFNRTDSGFRYVISALPFLYLFMGNISIIKNKFFRLSLLVTICYYVISSLLVHPHYLEYFNEIVGGSKNGYKYLADSNLDWGQNKKFVSSFLEKSMKDKRQIKIDPEWPTDGEILIDTNSLTDCFHIREKYTWLRKFEPVGNVGFSWLLFKVSPHTIMEEIKRSPDGYWYYILGSIYREKRNYIEAINMLKKCIEISPQVKHNNLLLAKSHYMLGLIFLDLGERIEAKREFETTLRIYPYFYEAYGKLGDIYGYYGKENIQRNLIRQRIICKILESYTVKVPIQKEYYIQRLTLESNDGVLHNNLGFVYWMENDLDMAIQEFEKAVKILPNYADIYASLASVYYEKKDSTQVLTNLKKYHTLLTDATSYIPYRIVFGKDEIILDNLLVIQPKEIIELPQLKQFYKKLYEDK